MADTDLTPLREWRRRKPGTREVIRSETRVELPDQILKRLADLEQRVGQLELATGETLPANDQSVPGLEALIREVRRMRQIQTERADELAAINERLRAVEDHIVASADAQVVPAVSGLRQVIELLHRKMSDIEQDVGRLDDAARITTEIQRRTQAQIRQLEAS